MVTISIHAARVGCDLYPNHVIAKHIQFQSTQPEWAATMVFVSTGNKVRISIHAARVGCDTWVLCQVRIKTKFQSTQPEWAATVAKQRTVRQF